MESCVIFWHWLANRDLVAWHSGPGSFFRVVCWAIQSLNDLLELAAFRANMQLLRVCYLVFPVAYSLGFCLGATVHACFVSWEVGVVSLL